MNQFIVFVFSTALEAPIEDASALGRYGSSAAEKYGVV